MSRFMPPALAALLLATAPAAAQTVTVNACDWQTSAQNIPEPWETHTRTFSGGATRLAMLDTIEPAMGWAWLMVLSPPEQEWGGRQCRVIGVDGSGFAGMDFGSLTADYDPSRGLSFALFVDVFDGTQGTTWPAALSVTLDQSTGAIFAYLQGD